MIKSPKSLLNQLIDKAIHARFLYHNKKEKPGKYILELNKEERARIQNLKSDDLNKDGLQKDYI